MRVDTQATRSTSVDVEVRRNRPRHKSTTRRILQSYSRRHRSTGSWSNWNKERDRRGEEDHETPFRPTHSPPGRRPVPSERYQQRKRTKVCTRSPLYGCTFRVHASPLQQPDARWREGRLPRWLGTSPTPACLPKTRGVRRSRVGSTRKGRCSSKQP